MPELNELETWQWWGDEGGQLLRVRRVPTGVRFETCQSDGTAAGTVVVASVTLANFRIDQLMRWLPAPAREENP
jgi:hypothetical protein